MPRVSCRIATPGPDPGPAGIVESLAQNRTSGPPVRFGPQPLEKCRESRAESPLLALTPDLLELSRVSHRIVLLARPYGSVPIRIVESLVRNRGVWSLAHLELSTVSHGINISVCGSARLVDSLVRNRHDWCLAHLELSTVSHGIASYGSSQVFIESLYVLMLCI